MKPISIPTVPGPLEADALVTRILAACGTGRFLEIGCGQGTLVRALLRAGADAYGLDPTGPPADSGLSGRMLTGSFERLPFADRAFDTVIVSHCLERLEGARVGDALRVLTQITRRALYVRIGRGEAGDVRGIRGRWEELLFGAGFRKHPAYYEINDYEALEADAGEIQLVLEPIPRDALRAYPQRALAAERDLHMDMTRETGARSDAHIVRYQLASRYVRPGDTVLDAACGLGYGSYLLQMRTLAARTIGIDSSAFGIDYATRNFAECVQGLEFRRGELPECLGALPDHSVDLVACFETLEHVKEPERLLEELARVLTPAGRIVASVPNDWSDESGRDPNPFHFHVYDWPRLRKEVQRRFVVETAYEQTASRRKEGDKVRTWEVAGRRLRKVTPDTLTSTSAPDCEWWVVVAMKDPLCGAAARYRESTYPQADSATGWNAVAFARDYVNPWLVKGLVTIGQRITDDAALSTLAQRVEQDYPPGSADRGAALTVQAYRALSRRDLDEATVADLARRCDVFLSSASAKVPHQARWTISILFVLGQLWQAVGSTLRAQACYARCAAQDALAFSPLLATKTVEASLRLAVLRMSDDDVEGCRDALQAGLDSAERALRADWSTTVGDRAHPVEFGLPEIAAVAERASACAYALTHLDIARDRPGVWWWQHQRDRLSQLEHRQRSEASLGVQVQESRALYGSLAGKEEALAEQAAEIHRLESVIVAKDDAAAALEAEYVRTKEAIGALTAQVESMRQLAAHHEQVSRERLSDLRSALTTLSERDEAMRAMAADAATLRAGVAEATGARRTAEADLAVAREELHAATADARRLQGELVAIRGSKWYALGETLRRRPFNRLALGEVLQLSARMLRKRVQRRVRWPEKLPAAEARQPASAIEPPAFQPYVIRQPVAGHAARPRIVHAIANFMTGGSSRLVVDLMEGLGSDYAQTVLTSFVPSPPGYVGAQVRELGSGAPASEFEEALAGAALVHVHYWGDCDQPWYVRVFAAAERLGIRMLENVNTPVSPHRSPAVARYVYVSQYVRGVFGHPSYPEEVVYPGSDLSLFTPEPGQPVAHDSVGIVYRLERDKLDERAIEPLIIAVQRRPGTRALVVGGGSLLEPFRRSVEEAGVAAQFTFTGYVAYEALPALYASLAVFVAPVWQESFGQVSTFAMSMGVPVVGYAVGAIPEILGDEALLAPPGDADALAQIIVRLLDEPDTRRAIATRNRQRAQATYSVQSMVERYRSLYASLVETGQVA